MCFTWHFVDLFLIARTMNKNLQFNKTAEKVRDDLSIQVFCLVLRRLTVFFIGFSIIFVYDFS
jgi:hypothetical protein